MGFCQRCPGLIRACDGGADFCLLLSNLLPDYCFLGGANRWIVEIGSSCRLSCAGGFQPAFGRDNDRLLLFGGSNRLSALAFRNSTGLG